MNQLTGAANTSAPTHSSRTWTGWSPPTSAPPSSRQRHRQVHAPQKPWPAASLWSGGRTGGDAAARTAISLKINRNHRALPSVPPPACYCGIRGRVPFRRAVFPACRRVKLRRELGMQRDATQKRSLQPGPAPCYRMQCSATESQENGARRRQPRGALTMSLFSICWGLFVQPDGRIPCNNMHKTAPPTHHPSPTNPRHPVTINLYTPAK